MYRDSDFDLDQDLPQGAEALIQDLELDTLLSAMAAGDRFLLDVARRAVLSSLADPGAIAYRQQVLADAIAHPDVVWELYDLAVTAIRSEKEHFFPLSESSDSIMYRSVQVLEMFAGMLKRLRGVAETRHASFRSDGFTRFFSILAGELDDDYLQVVEGHLKELGFRRGVLISAVLGRGNKGKDYVLRKAPEQGWRDRIPVGNRQGYSFYIPDRDENGYRALSDLRSRGLTGVANAAAQSNDHILGFFTMLRAELAFYIGCLNLREKLAALGGPVCMPVALPAGTLALTARGLYDPSLSLRLGARAAGSDLDADGKRLIVITGANQGGKSTFLRSAGLAWLMMQCGMFAAADSLTASVSGGVFTHFKREEDATMEMGKLDEELSRMSDIVGRITPDCLLLCNESFASTSEREGSEIARQVIRALLEFGVRVLFVTHLFDLSHSFWAANTGSALFLRPERHDDGTRTFRLLEGEPLPTSYGPELYRQIFYTVPEAPATFLPAAAYGLGRDLGRRFTAGPSAGFRIGSRRVSHRRSRRDGTAVRNRPESTRRRDAHSRGVEGTRHRRGNTVQALDGRMDRAGLPWRHQAAILTKPVSVLPRHRRRGRPARSRARVAAGRRAAIKRSGLGPVRLAVARNCRRRERIRGRQGRGGGSGIPPVRGEG
jgi:MutS domain V